MRQIFPVQGPDLTVVAGAGPGAPPPAVQFLAHLYGNDPDRRTSPAPGRGLLRANMVASADGAITVDGRSGGLSGPADKMLFTVLRSLADVIVVGAGTARAERYRPVQPDGIWAGLRPPGAPAPPVAVVTASLNLDGCARLLSVPPGPSQTIVITAAAAPPARRAALAGRARIIEAGEQTVDLAAAIAALRDGGYASILTEGGPALLGQLAAAGLLDELCLTTSPRLAAGRSGRALSGPPAGAKLSLAHVLSDDDFLFSRYLIA